MYAKTDRDKRWQHMNEFHEKRNFLKIPQHENLQSYDRTFNLSIFTDLTESKNIIQPRHCGEILINKFLEWIVAIHIQ